MASRAVREEDEPWAGPWLWSCSARVTGHGGGSEGTPREERPVTLDVAAKTVASLLHWPPLVSRGHGITRASCNHEEE